jgi:predicted nucleotidyltransferase
MIRLKNKDELYGIKPINDCYVDKNSDTVIYTLNRALILLMECNPNIIEFLGCKPEHYLILNKYGKMLVDNSNLFLSKKAIYSFGGYANDQLRRLQNALAHDSLPDSEKEKHIINSIKNMLRHINDRYEHFDDNSIKLYIGESKKQNFDNEIMMDIDLKKYPLRDFKSIYGEMSEICKTYAKLNNRNKKKDTYHLNKHASHLTRLYYMGIDILTGKGVNTYRKEHVLLKEIKLGKYSNSDGSYNPDFFEFVDELEKEFKYASKHTVLPDYPDIDKINELAIYINNDNINNNGDK